MVEVLSQNEIDELLKALSSGQVDPSDIRQDEVERIRKYDFKSANKFPKEQMKTLNIIYDNFEMLFSTFLTGTLGTYCDIDIIAIEEQSYHEFTNSFPSPVILAVLDMPPLEGATLLEMEPSVVYAIINRLFGGSSASYDTGRMFSEIDLVIIEKIIRQFLPLLNEAWGKVLKIDTMLDRIETSSQFAQIVSTNETIAIITMSVKIDGTEGLINFCIPHLAVEPIAKNLNTKLASWSRPNRKLESNSDTIIKRIMNTSLTLKAILSDTTVMVSDILNLQVGDVIQLDSRVGDLIKVKVEHMPKLYGTLGVKDSRYAIKVAEIIKEEDLNDE